MSWEQSKRVMSLVDGMKACQQPYIVVRFSSKGEVCGNGNTINGFIGFRFSRENNVRGAPMITGRIYEGEHMTFYCDPLGIAYAAIPDCDHNRRLLKATYGDAPFEIEECNESFRKELEECRKGNVRRLAEKNPKDNGPDAFNVTIAAKQPEGMTEKKAIMDKLMQKGDMNANKPNRGEATTAKS